METRSRMSRSLHTNRDFEKLEPYEGKPSRTVLRGEEGSNALDLPDRPSDLQQRDGRGVRAGNEIAKHFAENNVDVIIYAVEKSLDSYKFNLLHCKQTFISQLKSGAMGARTIDEGAMDEKSGMNFSEYMALLSGNTDLLDKAKLEKRIASLEGERKSFNKGKRDSEFKLESKTGTVFFPLCRLIRKAAALILLRWTAWIQRMRRSSVSVCRKSPRTPRLVDCTRLSGNFTAFR